MRDATDVCAQNGFGLHLLQMTQLAVAQLRGNGRLQNAVSTRRAAAQMRFVAGDTHSEAELMEMGLHAAFELLSVLQGAGRVKCHHALGAGLLR